MVKYKDGVLTFKTDNELKEFLSHLGLPNTVNMLCRDMDMKLGGYHSSDESQKPNARLYPVKRENELSVTRDNIWWKNISHTPLRVVNTGFNKSDLKTGMILEFDNHLKGIVLLGTDRGDIVSGCEVSFPLAKRTSNELFESEGFKGKVVKVLQPYSVDDYWRLLEEDELSDIHSLAKHTVIWERKESRRMTLEEIEDKLGFKVEIVD